MPPTGTIVEFSTGRAVDTPHPGSDAAAAIAESLYRGLKRRGALPRAKPISVSLPALCGVDDDTIHRLAAIAAAGALTPESAARMALRHASEIGRAKPVEAPRRKALRRYDPASAAPKSFAVKVGSGKNAPWVAVAPRASLGKLLEICREEGCAICLLIVQAPNGRLLVGVVTTPLWQVTLIGRSMRPGWRHVHDLMVVGGLPDSEEDRNAIGAGIVRWLRSRPHVRLTCDMVDLHRPPDDRSAAPVIQLMAVGMPALVHPRHGGRP